MQWTLLSQLMNKTLEHIPVDGWALESYVIGDCLKKNLNKFTFFPTGKSEIKFSFKAHEVFAINEFFSAYSQSYNIFLRQIFEPKLPPCKQLENF